MTVSTFNYTGATQSFVVPAGVTSIDVECWGAAGGGRGTIPGGYAKGALAVTPGETLNLNVGGAGINNTGSGTVLGGWNGGGNGPSGAGSGGGGTDVRQGGTALGNRKIIAGGGGGQGKNTSTTTGLGGSGGGTTGGNGTDTTSSNGGKGGTQTAGGAGGYNHAAADGSLGQGGHGVGPTNGGGGGGGGYYGGGGGYEIGGYWGPGGGGGSGYIGGVTSGTMNNSGSPGTNNGKIVLTYHSAPTQPGAFTSPTAGQVVDDTVTASHGASSDPDGDLAGYTMEYTLNNGSTWVSLGNSTSTSRTIDTKAWIETNTARLRVRAYDSGGRVSAWRESPTFTVSHGTYTPAMIL